MNLVLRKSCTVLKKVPHNPKMSTDRRLAKCRCADIVVEIICGRTMLD